MKDTLWIVSAAIRRLNAKAKEALIKFDDKQDLPSGAKARVDFAALTARLKPCPFKTSTCLGAP